MLPNLDKFLLNLKENNFSSETVYNYERDLNTFANFLVKEINIEFDKIDKNSIVLFKKYLSSTSRRTASKELASKQLSDYSINRILSALRSYIRFLIEINYRVPVTADNIKLFKIVRKYNEVPTMDELIQVIEAPNKFEKDPTIALRNRAMLETIFATGIHISELLSLKREDINKSGSICVMIKGKKHRFVYLTPRAIKYISAYLKTRHDDTPFLFIPYRGRNNTDKNKKISTNYLQSKIKRYRELLSINIPISAHSIRHSFATYLAESGANPAAIQILLGHESLETTTRYVHASDRYAEKSHTKYHPLKK